MKGVIFDIKRFAVHDGPGIRTTLFLKGCPMQCAWCHNPESWKEKPETIIEEKHFDGKSIQCKKTFGKWYSSEELIKELLKDEIAMEESGGGVTFSGGEPLMQYEFILDLINQIKTHGIHMALDTSGYSPEKIFREVVLKNDLILYDLKIPDNDQHLKYTGVENKGIISNLNWLMKKHPNIWIRIPIIPGINDDENMIKTFIEFLHPNMQYVKKISLLPYHAIGSHKFKKLGMKNLMRKTGTMKTEMIEKIATKFEKAGLPVNIGG